MKIMSPSDASSLGAGHRGRYLHRFAVQTVDRGFRRQLRGRERTLRMRLGEDIVGFVRQQGQNVRQVLVAHESDHAVEFLVGRRPDRRAT